MFNKSILVSVRLFIAILSITCALTSFAENNGQTTNPANVPAPGVANMIPSVVATPKGAQITADFHMNQLNSKVSVALLAIVVDPNGQPRIIEIKQLDNAFVHSATDYHTKRNWEINYDEINAELKKKAPNADLKVGPGTNLFVYARWMNDPNHNDMYRNTGLRNHEWGGTNRNGKIILPLVNNNNVGAGASSTTKTFTKGGVATSLDVGNHVGPELHTKFPALGFNTIIGSRFEVEPKYHVDLDDLPRVEKIFRDLTANPTDVTNKFGTGWTMTEDNRFVGSPMTDNYRDRDDFAGAKIGQALRRRFGQGVSSWNYKPDDGRDAGNGVVERIEFQMNAGDVPQLAAFVDSDDPHNPFQLLREKVPGAKPSDFLKNKAFLSDVRRKFKLKGPGGDEVEISLDHVTAQLTDPSGKPIGDKVEYGQLEIEMDHLGVGGSKNVVNYNNTNVGGGDSGALHGPSLDTYLASLGKGAKLMIDVPPIFHGEKDFDPSSPLKTTNDASFKLAREVFGKLSALVFPNGALPSGQKYAVAATALGAVKMDEAAPSVKRMVSAYQKHKKLENIPAETCLRLMVKLSPAQPVPAPPTNP